MGNHVPVDLGQFALDIANAYAVTVEHCFGQGVVADRCVPRNLDHMRVVVEPSLVMAMGNRNGTALLRTIPLDHALRVETRHAMGHPVTWTRSPQGLWLRFIAKR